MRIDIPFDPRFALAMERGTKTATTRYKCYGIEDDWFVAFGHTYRIGNITMCYLYRVSQMAFTQEGFASPAEFIDFWSELHPGKGYRPNDFVYHHVFYLEK